MVKNITIVSERPNERVLKIGFALRKVGINVQAVFRTKPYEAKLDSYFHSIYVENDTKKIGNIVDRLPGDVVHLHSYGYDDTCRDLLSSAKKAVLYDPKDVYPGILEEFSTPAGYIEAQRTLLESSGGLILRDEQADLSARILNYKLADHRLYFPDYCWSEDFFPSKDARSFKIKEKKSLKIVFVGNFWPERQPPFWSGAGQLPIFLEYLEQGHGIDFYPSHTMVGLDYSDYSALQKKFKGRFRMMQPVSYEAVVKKVLPSYDLATFFPAHAYFPESRVYWHPDLYRYGRAARVFDHATAGLITAISSIQSAYSPLVKDGLAIELKSTNLVDAISSIPAALKEYRNTKARIKAMQKWSIDRHIKQLIDFYTYFS